MFAVFRDLIRYNIEFTIGVILVGIVVIFAALSFFSPVDPSLIYMTIPDQPPKPTSTTEKVGRMACCNTELMNGQL